MSFVVALKNGIPKEWRLGFRRLKSKSRASIKAVRLRKTAESARLAALYYGLVNPSLSREAKAVAAGQLMYIRERDLSRLNYYLLRRNIHRLEKGLVMRPRRPVFGRAFIEETVSNYAEIARAERTFPSEELRWAGDVLDEYFAVVEREDPRIRRAYDKYKGALEYRSAFACAAESRIPYARDLSKPPSVDFDSFMALCRRRRSVRWYEDRPVPREIVDKALEAAAQAPSACNRQPFVYRIFDDPTQAREIAALAMGTKGFADKLQSLVVLVGQLRAYPFERDRHAIYIDASLSAMTFMLALETLGAASCPINWPDHEPHETRMRKRLNLAPDERVIMLIAFGWPDPEGKVPYSSKRNLDRIRSYNI